MELLEHDIERGCIDEPSIDDAEVAAYRVPTEEAESDGTLEWDHTTIVVVRVSAGGERGLGYTYTHQAAGEIARMLLDKVVLGRTAMSPRGAWWAMHEALRNVPARGLAMMAVSAIDTALWDLKAKLLKQPLCTLLGRVREAVPVYASGGFTSYDEAKLCAQLGGWAEEGFARVKMKVGRWPEDDPRRVRAARHAIGEQVELFVDANGAYTLGEATRLAHEFAAENVVWFEEPRPSDDPGGLAHVRERAPAGMEIAAGEYADIEAEFLKLIGGSNEGRARACDVVQPDVTRCGGVTGFVRVAALTGGHHVEVSTHCAPAVSLHPACACREVRHMEYFYDHVRLEPMLFDGVPACREGRLVPDLSRPGCGLELKEQDAERFRV